MSKSGDRFYQAELAHRPALYGDIGSNLRISGIVISGGDNHRSSMILFLPDISIPEIHNSVRMNAEEWSDFIQRSDDPEILVDPIAKIFHRKLRYAISGHIQQKVWAADNFECVYCNARMGDKLLTIDHFIPIELGGKNDVSNYVTACRRCNKSKGAQDPEDWLSELMFQRIKEYLEVRKV